MVVRLQVLVFSILLILVEMRQVDGVLIMKFATGYLVCLFAALFCAAQFADHLAAKMCAERTIMTYDQCRQHKP